MDKSGASSASVEKAQRDLIHMSFSWIDMYLKPRESKTNIIDLDTESLCSPGSSKFILAEDKQDSDNKSENDDLKKTDIEEMDSKPTK